MPRPTMWPLSLAFLGGLMGQEAAAPLAALGAFLLACANPRLTWRGAILSIAAWGAGTLVGIPLTDAHAEPSWAVVILEALASAYVGTALTWIAARFAREVQKSQGRS